MNVYVFLSGNTKHHKEARKLGLEKGVAVYGWGWDSQFDLNGNGKNPHYGKLRFLKDIKAGDKIIYVNYDHSKTIDESHYGYCTMMEVIDGYSFNNEIASEMKDFGHTIKINPDTMYFFHRNNPSIHPLVSKSLKPRSSYQRLYSEKELETSINNHKNGIKPDYFENEIDEGLRKIIDTIQRNHHDKALEGFLKPLLEKIYSAKYEVNEVKVNGSGWGTDNGADLIIRYKEKFDDLDINISSNKEYSVVVQAKSYKWSINDSNAIEQCKTAIQKYNAEYALLITTAKISDEFNEKIDEFNSNPENTGNISIIDGEQLAKLYIKHMK